MKGPSSEEALRRSWARYAAAVLFGGEFAGAPTAPGRLDDVSTLLEASLIPYVYEALKRMGDSRAAMLRSSALAVEFLSRAVDSAAYRVGLAFDAAGIPHVFIKGVAIRSLLGELSSCRRTTDVDVLVSPADYRRASQVLQTEGFERQAFQRPIHQRLYYEQVHAGLVDGIGVVVDLHRGLAAWPMAKRLSRSLLEHRQRRGDLWVPVDEHSLLVSAVHQYKQAPGADLRDAFDALALLPHIADPVDLARRARGARCGGALLALGLRMEQIFGRRSDIGRTMTRPARMELGGVHRKLVEYTVTRGEPGFRTTAGQLAGDLWRHSVCLGGPLRASLEVARVSLAVGADHLMAGIKSAVRWRDDGGPSLHR